MAVVGEVRAVGADVGRHRPRMLCMTARRAVLPIRTAAKCRAILKAPAAPAAPTAPAACAASKLDPLLELLSIRASTVGDGLKAMILRQDLCRSTEGKTAPTEHNLATAEMRQNITQGQLLYVLTEDGFCGVL